MNIISIEDAQARLGDLLHGLTAGDELVITENDRPIARIVSTLSQEISRARRLGTLHGTVLHIAPDFDDVLEDFREYMQ